MLAADAKLTVGQRARDEADRFSTITQQREAAGEVAHADTVRGDIQLQQRQRDLNEAKLAAERSRLDIGVLLFPDPTTPYTVASSLTQLLTLPSRAEIDAAAKANNPDLRAALESMPGSSAARGDTALRLRYFRVGRGGSKGTVGLLCALYGFVERDDRRRLLSGR
ncbi:TolC family protein [Tunturibacter empetritectus]|uniref:Outer membrane protein TolC n=1 Tax=Tunturiibacter lichenicola TaxID=2051959 RepID=A0A7W8N4P2_9BACT|nr:hypothetical protein [Edaphobacter lichenicola]MBB5343756.1 outer membrane protein TolC [Edaphobacter lichenicola]